jgi:hypothetical protein
VAERLEGAADAVRMSLSVLRAIGEALIEHATVHKSEWHVSMVSEQRIYVDLRNTLPQWDRDTYIIDISGEFLHVVDSCAGEFEFPLADPNLWNWLITTLDQAAIISSAK